MQKAISLPCSIRKNCKVEKLLPATFPPPGERHQVVELPQEFEKEQLFDLPKLLRVNAAGATPKFERK